MDLVQDRVRSRVYSVFLTLLIIIAAAYWALAPAFRAAHSITINPPVAELEVVLPHSYTVAFGDTLFPPPTVCINL